jgi:hypothetical protein
LINRVRYDILVVELEHQLMTLLVSHVKVVLLRQLRVIAADDSVIALLQVCKISVFSQISADWDVLVSSAEILIKIVCDTSTVWIGLDKPLLSHWIELRPLFLSCIRNLMSYGNRFSTSTGARSRNVILG